MHPSPIVLDLPCSYSAMMRSSFCLFCSSSSVQHNGNRILHMDRVCRACAALARAHVHVCKPCHVSTTMIDSTCMCSTHNDMARLADMARIHAKASERKNEANERARYEWLHDHEERKRERRERDDTASRQTKRMSPITP